MVCESASIWSTEQLARRSMTDDASNRSLFLGTGIACFRSFGDQTQILGPLTKVNVLAGENNVGKSNVLYFLRDQLSSPLQPRTVENQNNRLPQFPIHGATPFEFDAQEARNVLRNTGATNAMWDWLSERFLEEPAWAFLKVESSKSQVTPDYEQYQRLSTSFADVFPDTPQALNTLRQSIPPHTRMGQDARGFPELFGDLLTALHSKATPQSVPEVKVVSAIREVKKADTLDMSTGAGLVKRLARVFSANLADLESAEVEKTNLTSFVRSVLEDQSAVLNVSHDYEELQVTLAGRGTFDLKDMGTGIHEVVILAANATLERDSLLCIEEPEIHLHPVLLRRLVTYLASEATSNQYILTTHSAVLLDSPLASLFHVAFADGSSQIRRVREAHDRSTVVQDLGFRASDLVQTNAVIWVEGPSDHVYLRSWIEHESEGALVEGRHFSIASYGGALLAYLTADEAENAGAGDDVLVSLRNLNRNIALVMDSDRSRARAPLSPAKKRLKSELAEDSLEWTTQGHEIENYIPADIFSKALHFVHPRAAKKVSITGTRYEDRYSDVRSPQKVKIARQVVELLALESNPVPDELDLRERVRTLVRWITAVNE